MRFCTLFVCFRHKSAMMVRLLVVVLLALVAVSLGGNLNADNIASSVLYYFNNSDCSGSAVLITTRYLDYIMIHSGPTNISCWQNVQCELNSPGQPDGQCVPQLFKLYPVAGSSTDIITTASTYNYTTNSYNPGVGATLTWNSCNPSRSFMNCYFRALPISAAEA